MGRIGFGLDFFSTKPNVLGLRNLQPNLTHDSSKNQTYPTQSVGIRLRHRVRAIFLGLIEKKRKKKGFHSTM